jgi:hypothetical protein
MNTYLVQEEYKEYIRGVRIIMVEAESKQDVLDGNYDNIDIIDELTADGEVEETNLITDNKYLAGNWTQLVVECDNGGRPTE